MIIGCGPTDEDWPVYLGDSGRQHYSPLTEINRDNVIQLKVAWVYDSGEPRGAGTTMYTSPLVIDGVLYGLSPQLDAFALNAATGEEVWRSDLGLPGNAQRGLMWWEEGRLTGAFSSPTATTCSRSTRTDGTAGRRASAMAAAWT